jgi:hypothetical protein
VLSHNSISVTATRCFFSVTVTRRLADFHMRVTNAFLAASSYLVFSANFLELNVSLCHLALEPCTPQVSLDSHWPFRTYKKCWDRLANPINSAIAKRNVKQRAVAPQLRRLYSNFRGIPPILHLPVTSSSKSAINQFSLSTFRLRELNKLQLRLFPSLPFVPLPTSSAVPNFARVHNYNQCRDPISHPSRVVVVGVGVNFA